MKVIYCFFIICILSLPLFSENILEENEEDYLWISYKQPVKERDASVTLPLEVNWGSFPKIRKSLSCLENLRIFYSTGKKDNLEKQLYHELPFEIEQGSCHVKINSPSSGCFTVIAQAEIKTKGCSRFFSAETSFVLFGHSLFKNKGTENPVQHKVVVPLNISLAPRFDYWPQTDNPLIISLSFKDKVIPKKSLNIYDENLPPAEITMDAKGKCKYVPPDDRDLNWLGKTAFKQTIFVGRVRAGGAEYITANTRIFHRPRQANKKTLPGILIFAATAGAFLGAVVVKRTRRRHDPA